MVPLNSWSSSRSRGMLLPETLSLLVGHTLRVLCSEVDVVPPQGRQLARLTGEVIARLELSRADWQEQTSQILVEVLRPVLAGAVPLPTRPLHSEDAIPEVRAWTDPSHPALFPVFDF